VKGAAVNNRYIAFDVETPNSNNDRMSAIGITVVENQRIVEEYYYLVNPEVWFASFNISLTGISPKMVADKPNFGRLWREIGPIMESGVLVAHYAPFDMGVLASCLAFYQIEHPQFTRYACTCQMGRKALPGLPNHRLNTLCAYYGIDLNHHHAGSDSQACAQLLLYYMQSGLHPPDFMRGYDLVNRRSARIFLGRDRL
jgi:DNA polymerase III epsilon subunit family exonuclease